MPKFRLVRFIDKLRNPRFGAVKVFLAILGGTLEED